MKTLRVLIILVISVAVLDGCGKTAAPSYGLIAYSPQQPSPKPYAPSKLLIFDVNSGEAISEIELDSADMAWDVDLLLTPDKKTGLAVTSKGVFIFEVPSGKMLGNLKWIGQLPPPGVDAVITPDGKRGIVAHALQSNPVEPYPAVTLTIFEIPSGKVIGEVPLKNGRVAWDTDIQLTPDGKTGLVATAGGVVIFDTQTAKVLGTLELDPAANALVVGVDVVIAPDGKKGVVAYSTNTKLDPKYSTELYGFPIPYDFMQVEVQVFEIPTGKSIGTLALGKTADMVWDVDIKLIDAHTGLLPTSSGLYFFDLDTVKILDKISFINVLPQQSSDVQETSDGKIGIINYGQIFRPVAPYLPVNIKLFRIPEGSVIKTLELNYNLLPLGIDIVVTPDGKTALFPSNGYVTLIDTVKGDLLAQVETTGSPQLAVDLVVTPDGKRGMIATGSMVYPPAAYLPVTVTIFDIPNGNKVAEFLLENGSIPWDVDIQLSSDGKTALIAHTGYVTILDMESGKVKNRIDLKGGVPHFGVDLLLTSPAANTPDADEDFINPYLLDILEKNTFIKPGEKSLSLAPEPMPERVTLNVRSAAQAHLDMLVEYFVNRPYLFNDASQHSKFYQYIFSASMALREGARNEFVDAIKNAISFNNQFGMKSYNAQAAARDMLGEVLDWTLNKSVETQINYQPAAVDSFGNLYYFFGMSKEYKKELFLKQMPEIDAKDPAQVSSHDPVIQGLSFSHDVIAGDNPGRGTISFRDPDGDVNMARFTPLTSGCIYSKIFSFNPMDYLIEGNAKEGKFLFHQYCYKCEKDAEGDIRTQVILYDKAGHASDPKVYIFTCK